MNTYTEPIPDFDDIIFEIRRTVSISALRAGTMNLATFKRTLLLQNPVIQLFKHFMQELAVKCEGVAFRMNARDLLVSYLFAFYDFDDEMKECSLRMIDHLHTGDRDAVSPRPSTVHMPSPFVTRLGILVKDYEVAYTTWKPADKAVLLEEMCRLYWEYELVFRLNEANMTTEEVAMYAAQKDARQRTLINAMKSIDDLKAFSSFAPPVVFESSTVDQIRRTLALAFWDMVRDDIRQSPPIMDRVFSVFSDIRKHLLTIVKNDTHRIIDEFDDILDPGFVSQLYSSGTLGNDFWIQRCNFLIRTLGSLDSAHMETVPADWWKGVREAKAVDDEGTVDACIH